MLPALLILLAPAHAGSTSDKISAKSGGVLALDNIVVTIPAGALDSDAWVTLTADKPSISSKSPSVVMPLSQRYSVDLGGSSLSGELEVQLAVPDKLPSFATDEELILVATEDSRGDIHLSLPELSKGTLAFQTPDLSLWLGYIPDSSGKARPLQVPYYVQDGLNWCTPTALSMLLGYHGAWSSYLSNWRISGLQGLDRGTGGVPNYSVMETLTDAYGLDETAYDFYYWDSNLIGGTGTGGDVDSGLTFEVLGLTLGNYLVWQNGGYSIQDIVGDEYTVTFGGISLTVPVPDVEVEARPVQMTSIPGMVNHAFVGVGAHTTEGVYVHDSSAALTGSRDMAIPLSWSGFYSRIFSDSLGDELRTIVINAPARPLEERQGSLVLLGGSNNSLSYAADDGQAAVWLWDGAPYGSGAAWSDGTQSTALGGDALHAGGELKYNISLANITDASVDYTVKVILSTPDGDTTAGHELTVGAYTLSTSGVSGALPIEDDVSAGYGGIQFALYAGDELLDVKSALFRVQ